MLRSNKIAMHIGLFFGSFNPIHNGHLIIANYIVETTELEKVWLIVSPQNPFKQKETLLNEYDRLHLVNLGIGDNLKLAASDVEFKLPKPSYTIDTLTHLKEKYPQHRFSLIMGSDNLHSFHKWKNADLILKHHQLFVYKRKGYIENPYENNAQVHLLDVPLLEISASFIREHIHKKISMQYFLPEKVWSYIQENNLFS
jgi:nicotinate-nucleotide adenylyltransferase